MLHIILFEPQIAPNTGSVGRLCAVTNSRLHLIHPLGFEISDKQLRRAGMDYWHSLDVIEHQSWDAFLQSPDRPSNNRIFVFTTRALQSHWDTPFEDGDGLLFGNEGHGVPSALHTWAESRRVKIPQPNTKARSLNLATCVGIGAYEALRQITAP